MPPPTIHCEVCGKQFFKRSYPIHLKQCKIKHAVSTTQCPNCRLLVSNDEYSKHVQECQDVAPKAHRTVRVSKKAAAAAKANGPLEDGRYACAVCGRKFAEDRAAAQRTVEVRIRPRTRAHS